MKALKAFCEANNLQLVKIRYIHQFGYVHRPGWDIIKPSTSEILVSFEPVNYSNGNKWYLCNVHHNYTGPRYCKRITTKFLKNINVQETSFIHLGSCHHHLFVKP